MITRAAHAHTRTVHLAAMVAAGRSPLGQKLTFVIGRSLVMRTLSKAGYLLGVEGLAVPKLYVRGRRKHDYVNQLAAVIKDAMPIDDRGHTVKGEVAQKSIEKWWPFTDASKPVLVRRQTRVSKDAKTGAERAEEIMTILDGNHRVEAAKVMGLSHVPAKVIECSDREAALEQLSANVSHGLFLDRNSRNDYIKALLSDKELNIKQKDVALIVHLTPASVNRIISGKQGTASKASKKKRTVAKKRRAARLPGSFNTRTFFAELISVAGDYDKNSEAIDKAATGKPF